jgi:hypothetical protein
MVEGKGSKEGAVKQNLIHIQLPLCLGEPFTSEITFYKMPAPQIFIVLSPSRINSAGYSNFSCP